MQQALPSLEKKYYICAKRVTKEGETAAMWRAPKCISINIDICICSTITIVFLLSLFLYLCKKCDKGGRQQPCGEPGAPLGNQLRPKSSIVFTRTNYFCFHSEKVFFYALGRLFLSLGQMFVCILIQGFGESADVKDTLATSQEPKCFHSDK